MQDRLPGLSSSAGTPAAAVRVPAGVLLPAVIAIAAMFVGLRAILVQVREPFFDELYTIWIGAKSWPEILNALQSDSGPPLYYFLIGPFIRAQAAISQVENVRLLSLLAAAGTLAALLAARQFGSPRFVAALLLAFFPPHLYFSAEARPYALCAMLLGFASLLLESEEWAPIAAAAACLLAAAYTHYYAVLFLPVPVVAALVSGRRRAAGRWALAIAAVVVAFIPGLVFASVQPRQATVWMHATEPAETLSLAFRHFGFAAPFPAGFLAQPPLAVQILSTVLTLGVLCWGLLRSTRMRTFAVAAALPLALAIVLSLLGRQVYFPMRFESVIAVPLVLALSLSMFEIPARVRAVVLALFIAAGGWVCVRAVSAPSLWQPDSYRQTAQFVRAAMDDPRTTIVASGPLYLETISRADRSWHPAILPFPSAQGVHPGWRSDVTAVALDVERDGLIARIGRSFVWMGEQGSAEMLSLTRKLDSTVLFRRGPTVVLLMSSDRMQQ